MASIDFNGSFLEPLPAVRQHIIDGFIRKALDIFTREFDFFDKVTSISGVLFPLPKEERRAGIRRVVDGTNPKEIEITTPSFNYVNFERVERLIKRLVSISSLIHIYNFWPQ
ncbi:hypothetical protein AAHE18_17G125900 [Arachis hypogaea]